jgi:peptidase E
MEPDNPLLDEYVLVRARQQPARVCFVPTASGDAEGYIERFNVAFGESRCQPSHLPLFDRTAVRH